MGSYAHLRIGNFTLLSSADSPDPTAMMLFAPGDKYLLDSTVASEAIGRELGDGEDAETPGLEYRAPLSVVKDRLEVMGFSLGLVQENFRSATAALREEVTRRLSNPDWNSLEALRRLVHREIHVLEEITFERWIEAFKYLMENTVEARHNSWYQEEDDAHLPLLVRYMLRDTVHEGIWTPFDDFRAAMRAVVEIAATDKELVYDLSELVAGEYVDPNEDICAWARWQTADEFLLHNKIVVLTEGSFDKSAIQDALHLLYPHLVDYFSFMDFEGAKVSGGAGALVSVVKAFVGAGIVNRIIAIFDNDTAARSALRALRSVQLPKHVRVLQYPAVDWARSYPTLGPQGIAEMDVNGLAGSVELYLGLDVLREASGDLTPVQWRGYDEATGQYQGEVMNKQLLQARYAEKVAACRINPEAMRRQDWTGMQTIINLMRTAFH